MAEGGNRRFSEFKELNYIEVLVHLEHDNFLIVGIFIGHSLDIIDTKRSHCWVLVNVYRINIPNSYIDSFMEPIK